ncbi:MAG TPA: hypothetical protein VEU96_01590 [Bryobacteraceae bacterium]|nr:hypothetical protein [Bryobacteraceae bacterium]
MKRTQILAGFLVALLIIAPSCGTSDSIKSLLLTEQGASSGGFFNLAGQDGTVQLKVFAVYNSGKQIDVTTKATWAVTPVGCATTASDATFLCPGEPGAQAPNQLPPYGPTTVPINATGLMTGIVGLCTWTDALDKTKNPPAPANPPQWLYTGFYQTTASYRGFTTQPVAIGVGVTASDNASGCGPS